MRGIGDAARKSGELEGDKEVFGEEADNNFTDG